MFDFPELVDKIEDVPEEHRGLYGKGDGDNEGKFVLNVEAIRKDYATMANTMRKERDDRKTAQANLKEWTDAGFKSPEDVTSTIDDLKSKSKGKKTDDDDIERRLQAARDEIATKKDEEIKTLKEASEKANGSVQKYILDASAQSSLAKAGGSVDLLLPHVKSHLAVREHNGEMVVRVLNKEGDERMGSGGYMSVDELIAEIREQDTYKPAFKADPKGGAGSAPGNGGSGGATSRFTLKEWQQKVSEAKPEDRAKLLREKSEGKISVTTE